MKKLRVGVVGTGNILGQYMNMSAKFDAVEIVALSDLNQELARKRAEEFGVKRVLTPDQLMADSEVDLVLNLTVPKAHVSVTLAALNNGKHVYLEKPLGLSLSDARQIIDLAEKKNLRVGCAPDTFMGSGLQIARKVIEDGVIGKPVGFTAVFICPGHEHWHPSPQFFYQKGAGPMLDMGPYYITALLNLLGPVSEMSGMVSQAVQDRIIHTGPSKGQKIQIETYDHCCGTLRFENGVMGQVMTSFAGFHDTVDGSHPITIYGESGSMQVPDPNNFDYSVLVRRKDDKQWWEASYDFVKGYGRAIGVLDMAHAIASGRDHRASAQRALSALEIMLGFEQSSNAGKFLKPTIPYTQPAPMPMLPFGKLD